MKIEIRRAKKEDAIPIMKLNKILFEYEYKKFDKTLNYNWPNKNLNYFKNHIKNQDSFSIIASSKGKIIGYLIASIKEKEEYRNIEKLAEIENTIILDNFRGKGIGKTFFKELVKWAKEKKVKRLKVVASINNKDAINFYKYCGLKDYDLVLEGDI